MTCFTICVWNGLKKSMNLRNSGSLVGDQQMLKEKQHENKCGDMGEWEQIVYVWNMFEQWVPCRIHVQWMTSHLSSLSWFD